MRISACMIAKNEEKNIQICIDSYKEIVDEIIVVDTGSEDKTIEIAKSLGAKVYYFEWINDFAAAKNFALDKSKGDWIIYLDADEYFDKSSTKKIKGILKKLQNTKYEVVGCKITNIDKVNNNVIDSFLQARIFRNDKNIRYKSSVHEGLHNKKGKLDLISFYDEINIYHTGYSSDINKEKAKRNLDILLKKIENKGENPNYYRYLCDCYFSLGDYENALKYGKLHLNSGIKIIGYQSRMYKVVIDCMWKLGKSIEKIERKIKEAIKLFPDHPNFYCSYAFLLFDKKRYDEALENFLLTLKYNESYSGVEVNFILGLIPYINFKIGFIYELKNYNDKALQFYYECLKKDKYNKEAFCSAFQLIKKEKLEEIIAFLNSIYDINNENHIEFLVNEFIKIKPQEVLAYYTNIWYKRFYHEDSALSFMLFAQGKYETAFKVFHKGYMQNYDNSNAVLSIASALLSENTDNIESLLNIVKPSYKRILISYTENRNKLYEEDIDAYILILRELMLFNKMEITKKYVNLKNNFKVNIVDKIAKVFMDNYEYKEAVKYYEEYNKESSSDEAYMLIGYCYYKLNDYNNAYRNLKKAIEKGYNKNDVYQFLEWIEE